MILIINMITQCSFHPRITNIIEERRQTVLIKCSTDQHPAIGVFVGDRKTLSRLTALVVYEDKVKIQARKVTVSFSIIYYSFL